MKQSIISRNQNEEIKNTGGTIVFDYNIDRKAFYDENGYFVCVFTDPDGHKFNLLYM
ncbi:hypothetical protein [Algoriphagus sp.]|uniref:hypothetical protein n=1 Tax=Algoriphagus sp. TaxID=1872435 RepID=UPI003F728F5C